MSLTKHDSWSSILSSRRSRALQHGCNGCETPTSAERMVLTTSIDWSSRANKIFHVGSAKSSLDGRLIAIKDNICTKSLPTTCASAILDKFTSPFDATVVKALEHAGAIAGPKTNLDEFGMGSHSTNSAFGPVKSGFCGTNGEPLSAGGSSGGSAVAVATEQCYAYVPPIFFIISIAICVLISSVPWEPTLADLSGSLLHTRGQSASSLHTGEFLAGVLWHMRIP